MNKILQLLGASVVKALVDKVFKPLIESFVEKWKKRKKKKNEKRLIKDLQNAKTKKDRTNTLNKLP